MLKMKSGFLPLPPYVLGPSGDSSRSSGQREEFMFSYSVERKTSLWARGEPEVMNAVMAGVEMCVTGALCLCSTLLSKVCLAVLLSNCHVDDAFQICLPPRPLSNPAACCANPGLSDS